jgi:hypothetical protein
MDNSDITINDDILDNLSQDNKSYFYKKFKDAEARNLKDGLLAEQQQDIGSSSLVFVESIKGSKTGGDSVLDDYAIL